MCIKILKNILYVFFSTARRLSTGDSLNNFPQGDLLQDAEEKVTTSVKTSTPLNVTWS